MTNDTRTIKPSHRAFFEVKGRDGKTVRRIEIGAAWPHKDGQGYGVKLDVTPPAGSFISFRSINATDREEA